MRHPRLPLPEAGTVFGRWTVLEAAPAKKAPSGVTSPAVKCRCRCGTVKDISAIRLRKGNTRSCGCLQRELMTRHGKHETRTCRLWRYMLARCKPGHTAHPYYFDRGVIVCQRWQGPDGFANFLTDMGECPPGLTLDRIDNDGGYEPGNCRWATWVQQAKNRRTRLQMRQGM